MSENLWLMMVKIIMSHACTSIRMMVHGTKTKKWKGNLVVMLFGFTIRVKKCEEMRRIVSKLVEGRPISFKLEILIRMSIRLGGIKKYFISSIVHIFTHPGIKLLMGHKSMKKGRLLIWAWNTHLVLLIQAKNSWMSTCSHHQCGINFQFSQPCHDNLDKCHHIESYPILGPKLVLF